MSNRKGILVSRTDRLGDVLLSLPSLLYLRQNHRDEPIYFLVSETYRALLNSWCQNQKIQIIEKSELEKVNPRVAIFLHYESNVVKAVKKKKVPIRIGPYSKINSFFLLNRGLLQRRSLSKRNEAEYCLDLAKLATPFASVVNLPSLILPVHPEGETRAKNLLKDLRIHRGFFVVHPGMGGSALNLPIEKYALILNRIREKHPTHSILLSSGNSFLDQSYKDALAKSCPFLVLLPTQDLVTLGEIFRLSQGVLAPSTGPLHLAHLVGVPTHGFYSPVRTHLAARWKPFGGLIPPSIYSPNVHCPAKGNCKYERCSYYNCMETTDWLGLFKI